MVFKVKGDTLTVEEMRAKTEAKTKVALIAKMAEAEQAKKDDAERKISELTATKNSGTGKKKK
jgi:hypothetical protein|tara:strand:- start:301 stop:489 length:189 start_codon:yes stop_codon:yes gene_type:complete